MNLLQVTGWICSVGFVVLVLKWMVGKFLATHELDAEMDAKARAFIRELHEREAHDAFASMSRFSD